MSGLDFLFGEGGLQEAVKPVWAEPAQGLAKALGLEGQNRRLGANEAFLLDAEPKGWLVLSGTLDLFLLSDRDAGPNGEQTRHHVLRVEAGGLALPLGGNANAHFLAVPSNGAELVAFDWHALFRLAASDDLGEATAAALTEWLTHLAMASAESRPPKAVHLVDPSAALTLIEGHPIAVNNGVYWLATDEAALTLPKQEKKARHIPMAPGLWVQPGKAGVVQPLSMTAWSATPQAISDLAAFQDYAVAGITAKAVARRDKEFQRVQAARQRRGATFASALASLGGVLASRRVPLVELPKEPIAAAAMLVWREMGLHINLPLTVEAAIARDADPISALGHKCGLLQRKVHLADGWWQSDQGPLLGFYGPDKRPCALLPVGVKRYQLADPDDGTVRQVDADLAKAVASEAFIFCAPFAERRVGPRELLKFGIRNTRYDIVTITTMAIVTGILSLALPVITGWVVDPVIPEARLSQLAILIAALIVAGVSITAFSLVQSLAMLRLEGGMSNRVQSAVWDRLLGLPASFFRRFNVGDLTNRAQGIDRMRALMTGTVTAALLHVVSGLFSLGFMVFISWQLAAVTVLVAALYSLVVLLVGKRILSHNRETLALTGQLQGLVLQLLGAVGKLRVAGAEPSAFARWTEPYARLLRVSYLQQRLNNLLIVFKSTFHFLAIGGLILVVALQGHEFLALFKTPSTWAEIDAEALHRIMPTGKFMAFHVAFGQFLGAVFGITQTLVHLTNIKPLYERIQPILEAEKENQEEADDPGELIGDLEIRDVRFRYDADGPLILDGLSLRAEPGEFVAIVGPSGAGKSTLVRLLLGFDTPEGGSLFYDGKDIKLMDKRLLRRQLGVVLQNGRLLSGSLFQNISAGANLSRDDAMEAARLAGLDKDIERMPMGLETFLGEGAATLSGGQRQRLMIARAVVRKPRLLIFDEATSALDNETQAVVSEGLKALSATRIVIAHRLSTIVDADRIYVISDGRMVEEGNFKALMAKGGLFADLARRQMV